LKKWLQDKRPFKTCKAEIWTAGPLGRDARDTLYRLAKPKTDQWEMVSGEALAGLLPHAIKTRGVQLLRAITLEETEDEGG
jgi:hypothetical protein